MTDYIWETICFSKAAFIIDKPAQLQGFLQDAENRDIPVYFRRGLETSCMNDREFPRCFLYACLMGEREEWALFASILDSNAPSDYDILPWPEQDETDREEAGHA